MSAIRGRREIFSESGSVDCVIAMPQRGLRLVRQPGVGQSGPDTRRRLDSHDSVRRTCAVAGVLTFRADSPAARSTGVLGRRAKERRAPLVRDFGPPRRAPLVRPVCSCASESRRPTRLIRGVWIAEEPRSIAASTSRRHARAPRSVCGKPGAGSEQPTCSSRMKMMRSSAPQRRANARAASMRRERSASATAAVTASMISSSAFTVSPAAAPPSPCSCEIHNDQRPYRASRWRPYCRSRFTMSIKVAEVLGDGPHEAIAVVPIALRRPTEPDLLNARHGVLVRLSRRHAVRVAFQCRECLLSNAFRISPTGECPQSSACDVRVVTILCQVAERVQHLISAANLGQ